MVVKFLAFRASLQGSSLVFCQVSLFGREGRLVLLLLLLAAAVALHVREGLQPLLLLHRLTHLCRKPSVSLLRVFFFFLLASLCGFGVEKLGNGLVPPYRLLPAAGFFSGSPSHPDDAQQAQALARQVAQPGLSNPAQVLCRGQQDLVVVAGLHALPAVVRILNQLVDGGGQRVSGLLLLVPLLQQGQQVGVPVADKLVAQKVGDLEIDKAAFPHQPGQVGGGHRFLPVKGGAVEGSGRLGRHVPVQQGRVSRQLPAVLGQNLAHRVGGDVVGGAGAGKALHAKSKVGGGVGGVRRRRPVLSPPHHGDKTRFDAAGNVSQQPGGVQKIGALFFGSRVPGRSGKKLAPVGLQLVGGQVCPGLKLEGQQVLQVRVDQQAVPGPVNVLAVKKIAGVGGGVLELHVGRPDGAPRVGQSPLEVVGPARLRVVPHLSLPQTPLNPRGPGPVKISPVDAQGSPEPATPPTSPFSVFLCRHRFGLHVPGTAKLVVTPVVDPVLVVVVHKDEGRLQVGLVKHQGQVCPLATVPAETQLPGAGVHAAAGQTGLSVLVSGALPVPVSPQGQVLGHQTLLSLGHVEPGPLHPQPSDPVVPVGPPGPLARRRLTVGLFLLLGGPVQHVEGSRAHGHVGQTCKGKKQKKC